MDRNQHKKYIPTCPRNIGVVDQYSWTNKDTTDYHCNNGISHPIYECNGDIQFSLPLEMYPPVNRIHPQVMMTKRSHLNWRDSEQHMNELMRDELPKFLKKGASFREDYRSRDLYEDESRYSLGRHTPPFIRGRSSDGGFKMNLVTGYDGYPLPNPYTNPNMCGGLY